MSKENELEKHRLIKKYKKYSIKYPKYCRTKAKNNQNKFLSLANLSLFFGIIFAIFTVLYDYVSSINEHYITTTIATDNTLQSIIQSAYVVGRMDFGLGILIPITFGFVIITVVMIFASLKYSKETDFYNKVIDTKMDENKY